MIDQEDVDLAAIIRIHRARRIQNGNAMPCRKPRARTNLGLKAGRQRDTETCWNERIFSRRQHRGCVFGNRGEQVEARGERALIRW